VTANSSTWSASSRLGDAGVHRLALGAIRRRDFVAHGAWMTRGYAIGLGAGTQVLTHPAWFVLADGKPGELPRAVMMGAGWIVNVAVRRMDDPQSVDAPQPSAAPVLAGAVALTRLDAPP
jgi:hypothetical protein